MAAGEDRQPVEALGADEAFSCGARIGVWITLISSLRKTSSKALLNLLSRSWIKNRIRSSTGRG
jgi:hypothetical protein